MKQYRRTNKPNTCLWCGQPLKPNYGTNTHVLDDAAFIQFRDRHDRPKTFNGERVTGADSMRRAVLTRGKVESYGTVHGLFHSGRCAQAFGTAAALNGYRFQPETEK